MGRGIESLGQALSGQLSLRVWLSKGAEVVSEQVLVWGLPVILLLMMNVGLGCILLVLFLYLLLWNFL